MAAWQSVVRVERHVWIEKRLFRHEGDAGVRGRVPAGHVDRTSLPSVAVHELDVDRGRQRVSDCRIILR